MQPSWPVTKIFDLQQLQAIFWSWQWYIIFYMVNSYQKISWPMK